MNVCSGRKCEDKKALLFNHGFNTQVQEWFKNRRKKDKLLKERTQPKKRGRPSNSNSAVAAVKKVKSAETLKQVLTSQNLQHQAIIEIDTRSLLSQIPQHTAVNTSSHLTSLLSASAATGTPSVAVATTSGSGQLNLENSSMDTVAGHELQVASSIELTM